MDEFSAEKPCRILSLDGGGAKGFYTLGVLREIEGMVKCPLHEKFDLIFGTSTGAIIAALLALGKTVKEIADLYETHVPTVMKKRRRGAKSAALAMLGEKVFKDARFTDMKTGVGIVTTRWFIERPMIFKTSIEQAHGRTDTFSPGFGVRVSDADPHADYVFLSERKAPLSIDGAQKLIERFGEAAKLRFPIHAHMLRHAAGYTLAARGVDTRTLQAFMGHRSIANTVVYTAVADKRVRNIWGK